MAEAGPVLTSNLVLFARWFCRVNRFYGPLMLPCPSMVDIVIVFAGLIL